MSAGDTNAGEMSRTIKPRLLPADPVVVEATEAERAALARRFGVTAVHALRAEFAFDEKDAAILATGTVTATIEQPCAITAEDFTYDVSDPVTLRFVPASATRDYAEDEEVELAADDLDEIVYEGEMFDLGEAVAQSLGLAIDPYREGPDAETARESGLISTPEASGPFAALAALKKP